MMPLFERLYQEPEVLVASPECPVQGLRVRLRVEYIPWAPSCLTGLETLDSFYSHQVKVPVTYTLNQSWAFTAGTNETNISPLTASLHIHASGLTKLSANFRYS